jgi:hypothetical protein
MPEIRIGRTGLISPTIIERAATEIAINRREKPAELKLLYKAGMGKTLNPVLCVC